MNPFRFLRDVWLADPFGMQAGANRLQRLCDALVQLEAENERLKADLAMARNTIRMQEAARAELQQALWLKHAEPDEALPVIPLEPTTERVH